MAKLRGNQVGMGQLLPRPTVRMNAQKVTGLSWPPSWAIWAALVLVALVLRGYRITGWLLSYDEGHWLLYILRPELQWETEGSSYARPDRMLVWLGSLSVGWFGANELAIRLWPVLFGALTVLPLGWFVSIWTGDKAAGKWAAALLAVSPMHVYLSAQAIPDVVALFFICCALVGFAYVVRQPRPIGLVTVALAMAAAILTKASALYLAAFLLIVGPVFLRGSRIRLAWSVTVLASVVPFLVVVCLIKTRGGLLTFIEQPTVRSGFGIDLGRIAQQINLFTRFSAVNLVPMVLGAWVAYQRDRKTLLWLGLLALVVVTPTFRVAARELLYTLPAVSLFSGLAVETFGTVLLRAVVLAALMVASLASDLIGVPIPPLGPSFSDRTTAVLDRPKGWPSRDAAQWLEAHLSPDDAILVTGLGFTDVAVIRLHRLGVTMYPAASNWERLRDPSNRVKYAVFVDDHRLYAPQLAQYCVTHFAIPADASFPGYTIYACRKDERFVAYPDAFNSASVYVQRGVEFLQRNQCDQAIDAFQSALRVDPTALASKRNLMTAFLECGRKEDAARLGAKILQSEPDDPMANANMAILDLELGRVDDVLAQCRKNIRLNIAPAISYGVLGQLFERQDDLLAAVEAFRRSLAFDPTNQVTLQLLAAAEAKLRASPAAH